MKNVLKFAACILVCQLAGVIGSIFTVNSIPTWYAGLNKPVLNPPNWIFGPVWLTLYVLMGISLFLILKNGLDMKANRNAFYLFAAQLFFNAIWSIIFFGLHQLFVSVMVIFVLWLLILSCILSFRKISAASSYLMFPYLLWVSFAAYLNVSFLLLN